MWGQKVATGSTSELWQGRWGGRRVLLKLLDCEQVLGPEAAEQQVQRELTIHKALAPKYALRPRGSGRCPHPTDPSRQVRFIALEFVEAVPLVWMIESTPRGDRTLQMSMGMVEAIQELHQHGYLHRDMQPGNFLCCHQDRTMKVFDLGFAAPLGEVHARDQHPRAPRFEYECPRFTGGLPGDEDSDLYTAGMLGLTLLGVQPKSLDAPEGVPDVALRFFHGLIGPNVMKCQQFAQQQDADRGLDGRVQRPEAEPLAEGAIEPEKFVEMAAAIDALRHTAGFEDSQMEFATVRPNPDGPKTAGIVVRCPVTKVSFSIYLVPTEDVEGFIHELDGWLKGFADRYSAGQRETFYAGTRFRAIEPELFRRMQAKGVVVPFLGAAGAMQSAANKAVRVLTTH